MASRQLGPRYCPKCGKELTINASTCISCGAHLVKDNNISIFLPNVKERKKKVNLNEKTIRLRRLIGFVICGITTPFMLFTGIILYNPFPFYYTIRIFPYEILFLIFPAYFASLGLIYFSIQTKYKGIFLMIIGFFLFSISFLFLPSFNYYRLVFVILVLVFIDLPISIMVFLGILISFNQIHHETSLKLAFILVLYSNIAPYFHISIYAGF